MYPDILALTGLSQSLLPCVPQTPAGTLPLCSDQPRGFSQTLSLLMPPPPPRPRGDNPAHPSLLIQTSRGISLSPNFHSTLLSTIAGSIFYFAIGKRLFSGVFHKKDKNKKLKTKDQGDVRACSRMYVDDREPRNARVLDSFRREWGCFRWFAGKHSHHLAQAIQITSEQGAVGKGWCGGAWAWPLYSHLRGHNDWSKTLAGVSSPANQNSCPKSLHLK